MEGDKALMFRLIVLSVLLIGFSGCAFIDHHDKRQYPFKTTVPGSPPKAAVKVMVSTPLDNIVSKMRNNYGSETADITVPHQRSEVIKFAVEQEFANRGYIVSGDAKNALVIRVNQLETELAQEDMKAGFFGACDVLVYLKTDKGVYERNITAFNKVESYVAVGPATGVDVFYNVVKQCAEKISALASEKL